MSFSARMRDLMKKYGKVALGVHFSVSFASIGGLYVAINNNVDVEALFHKIGLSSGVKEPAEMNPNPGPADPTAVVLDSYESPPTTTAAAKGDGRKRNRTAEMAASSGGALALAVLCNKALFPVRVPITIALTPPIARFLARRNLIKSF